MNNMFHICLTFALGASAGAVVTWGVLKNKYARLAEDEIAEVRAFYSKKAAKDIPEEPKKTVKEYASELSTLGYRSYSDARTEESEPEDDEVNVITPEEFGILDEYETVGLTYYADGILAHDNGEVVEDVGDYIGNSALNRIGEFCDDAVYVRNCRLKTDYEVIVVSKNYCDLFAESDENPRLAGGK